MSNQACVVLDSYGRTAAQTYHETLWGGVEAWWNKLTDEALEKGYGVPDRELSDLTVEAMSYETNQRILVPYVKPDPKSKKADHAVFMSIYRLQSGRYEFTCYNS